MQHSDATHRSLSPEFVYFSVGYDRVPAGCLPSRPSQAVLQSPAFSSNIPVLGDYRRRRVRSGLPSTMAAIARNSTSAKAETQYRFNIGTPKAARLRGAGVERLWNERFWRRVQPIAATFELINFTGRVTRADFSARNAGEPRCVFQCLCGMVKTTADMRQAINLMEC
jgi:hypothetical protein